MGSIQIRIGLAVARPYREGKTSSPGSCDAFGNGLARLWDIDTGYEDQVFSGHDEGAVRSVVFSPDGAQVLTGCEDHTAKLWDVGTGQVIRTFSHDGAVYSVDFALDGLRVMTTTTGTESLAIIWSTADGSQLTTFTGHSGGVAAGKFTPKLLRGCSLPEIIDHYRYSPPPPNHHRRGGFFSSGFELMYAQAGKKRLLNECNHNYLWMAFATGSVGGPAPDHPNAQSPLMKYWDVGGKYYTNTNARPNPISLNCQTDEILDSMLSLSRFTSLVRWEHVKDTYRPVSTTPLRKMVFKTTSPPVKCLAKSAWIWTSASDGTITVGWLLFNYPQDHGVPEWEDNWTHPNPPRFQIDGLDDTQELELAWFDDHRGILVGNRVRSTTGSFDAEVPGTEANGKFGKSIAFLIQPVGFTPEKHFAELPNEPICQIVVDPRYTWDEERPDIARNVNCAYSVRTSPELDDPETTYDERQNYYYYWDFGDHGLTNDDPPSRNAYGWGLHTVENVKNSGSAYDQVTVTIYKDNSCEDVVSGDIIHVLPWG